MSTIIRATDNNRAAQATTFNFDDMATQAHQYLERIRGEAGKIVTKAHEQAATIRKQAEADGRQAAMQAQERLVAAQLANVVPALRKAVDGIEEAKQSWLRHWEQSAVHVAAAIAARVIRRELVRQPEIPVELVREALQLAAGSTELRIHLNAADHKAIAGQVETLVKELAASAKAEIIADASIEAGGCRIETRFGVIDQQIASQLARIEEELGD
jgi:flagellar assembly protein FliH